MSKEHLIDISSRPDFKEITARGGRVRSDKKKFAQQMNAIPKMKPETLEKKAWALIADENLSAFEIERLILEMLKQDLKPELRARLIDTAIKAHQAIHGSKSKNLNININYEKELEEFDEKWKIYQFNLKKAKKKIEL